MERFAFAGAIERSLELAAERSDDLTPLVYQRLFARLPQMQALFVRDTTGAVKGEMLARALEAILDYVGERRYAQAMIGCEAVTHAGYDVPAEDFALFFEAIAESLRHVLGGDWTGEFATAWARLVRELDLYARNGTQPAALVAAQLG